MPLARCKHALQRQFLALRDNRAHRHFCCAILQFLFSHDRARRGISQDAPLICKAFPPISFQSLRAIMLPVRQLPLQRGHQFRIRHVADAAPFTRRRRHIFPRMMSPYNTFWASAIFSMDDDKLMKRDATPPRSRPRYAVKYAWKASLLSSPLLYKSRVAARDIIAKIYFSYIAKLPAFSFLYFYGQRAAYFFFMP